MLPTKIRSKLIREFGDSFFQFPPDSIVSYLTKFDSKDNIISAINASRRDISKIQFFHPDGYEETIFSQITNTRKIINKVHEDSSLNYHDYLTTFNFKTDHPIYDLIVEVKYQYVYS